MHSFCKHRRLPLIRRSVSACFLCVYVAVSAGVPLPIAREVSDGDDAFPCMHSGCGCNSAERCWSSCCCHTLAERLAWARAHGVRPPDSAIAAARRAGEDLGWLSSGAAANDGTSCCRAAPREAACCAETSDTAGHACCIAEENGQDIQVAASIVAWRAIKCRGQSLNWLTAVPTLVPPSPVVAAALKMADRLGPLTSDVAVGTREAPDSPPPEFA